MEADVVVIGMGPGGEDVAGRLASAGLDVVGIEGALLGGECPYWGCIPSKMMVRAAALLAEARRIPGRAGTAAVVPDWAPVATRVRDATDSWDDAVAVRRFESKGGRFLRGWARVAGPGRATVADTEITASRAIVLATGAKAWAPPIPGLADVPYWTNREAIETEIVPESLVVLGGGAIGVELGQVFARFGARVSIVEVAPRLVPLEEPESSELLMDVLAEDGIDVRVGASIPHVRHDADGFALELGDGATVGAQRLLVATGRRPDLRALRVGALGLDENSRALETDGRLRVADGVWAVGDVTGHGAFTHVAMYQAAICADDILGRDPVPADYKALPRVTFTDPEIGSVGLTEEAARAAGLRVRVGHADVAVSSRGWIHGGKGLVKLVEDAERGVLVGATFAAPAGGEAMSMLALAIHAEVLTASLRRMIYAYPTFHRAIEAALHDLDS